MRTYTLDLEGKHILCLSLRAVQAITEKYGGVPEMLDALTDTDTARRNEATLWVLRCLADAGGRYAKLNGLECDALPEPVEDAIGPYDMPMVRAAVFAAISNGKDGTIRTKPKNADAAPEDL